MTTLVDTFVVVSCCCGGANARFRLAARPCTRCLAFCAFYSDYPYKWLLLSESSCEVAH